MYQSGFPINGLQSFEVSLGLLGSKVFVFWHSLYFRPINALLWLSRLWPRSWCQSQFHNGYRQFLKGHRDGMTPPGWVEKDFCEKQACSYVRWYLEAGGYEIISIHQRASTPFPTSRPLGSLDEKESGWHYLTCFIHDALNDIQDNALLVAEIMRIPIKCGKSGQPR